MPDDSTSSLSGPIASSSPSVPGDHSVPGGSTGPAGPSDPDRAGRNVTIAADGRRWRVSRRWSTRRPRIRERFKRGRDGGDFSPFDVLDAVSLFDDLAGLALGLLLMVLAVIVVIVFLPLIGVMFEIALLIALIASGSLLRIVSLKPWIIDAESLDDPAASRRFAVKGWLRSRRTIAELRSSLATGGRPAVTEAAEIPIEPLE